MLIWLGAKTAYLKVERTWIMRLAQSFPRQI